MAALLAQMDVGPMVPGAYALVGLVVIPAALVALTLAIRRQTRSVLTIALAAVASLLLIAWVAGLIDLQYEPSFDDVRSVSVIEGLPEVKAYESEPSGDPALTREAKILDDPTDLPGCEITIGVFDRAGHTKAVWHVFTVNAVSGEVQVLGPNRKWESLQAWRAASAR